VDRAFDDLHEAERNILLFVLTDARARSLFGEAWAQESSKANRSAAAAFQVRRSQRRPVT
jgi:hypothetical protein